MPIEYDYNSYDTQLRCGKVRYHKKKEAITALNKIMTGHRRQRPNTLRCYPCPDCGGWHLTKK